MDQDQNLIKKILAGHRRAFEDIIRKHQRLVNHIVFRMVPDGEEREDICQDIFMKVYSNLSRFRGESKLSTWIARIAYNRCVDYTSGRNAALTEGDCGDLLEKTSDCNPLPDAVVENKDISNLLRSEIEKLPRLFRTVLTLYHLDQMSYAEIGYITNFPDGTVKSYLFRARKMLRERLLSKYAAEELWQ